MAHDVTNVGNDRDQLSNMAGQAKAVMGVEALDVLADRGYFKGEEVLACAPLGVTPYVPKPLTSGSKAAGRFGKQDFVYIPEEDAYRCPADQRLTWRFTSAEKGMTLHSYWASKCAQRPTLIASIWVAGIIAAGATISLIAEFGSGSHYTQLSALLLMAPAALLGGLIYRRFEPRTPA